MGKNLKSSCLLLLPKMYLASGHQHMLKPWGSAERKFLWIFLKFNRLGLHKKGKTSHREKGLYNPHTGQQIGKFHWLCGWEEFWMGFAGLPCQQSAQRLCGPRCWEVSEAILLGWTCPYQFTYHCKHLVKRKRWGSCSRNVKQLV